MIRRLTFRTIAGLAAMLLSITMANAESPQNWPHKPVRLVVAAPAGSSVDIVARVIADGLKEKWPTGIVVDNKPAAGGTAAAAEVARSAADGYTLFLGYNGPLATAPALYAKLSYDPLKDFVPIILAGSQPNLLAVNANVPASNLGELVKFIQTNPGKFNYASVGNGSASHLCMELMKKLLSIDVVHVPFNGGPPAMQAVVAGDVQMLFAAPSNLMGQVRAGKLKAIAVTGRTRFAPMADIPTVAESGIPLLANFEALAWNGIVAPVATDRKVVALINREVNAVLARPDVRKKLLDAGIEPGGGSEDNFGKLIRSESEKWGAVIRATGARID
jgi:tripartite-type tricarboxylate transporter receptor subunit TctC